MINMIKQIIFSLAATATLTTMAQEAHFTRFSYTGQEARFDKPFSPETEYWNPILPGFYPDPSLCRRGDTYYLACSSFAFAPGVPLFKSTNLVDWTPLGGILTRESQLPLRGQQVSAGIFAPAIAYNERNQTFYMITTNVGAGNFYVKTKDPEKGCSDPIYLPQVDGIDPSFFFDRDGSAYIVHNGPVMGGHDYEGQRAIRLLRFDVEGDSILPLPAKFPVVKDKKNKKATMVTGLVGPQPSEMANNGYALEIVRGGTHVQERPIWIEGPHLYRIGNYYYLMCAEGGTCDWHSEVIFRSMSPYGPWEEAPNNPILTQRTGLDPQRPDAVTSTGHADMIQTQQGDWYAVFLGCRPYEDDYYNTGRDTYMVPVSWSNDGWPTILASGQPVPTKGQRPNISFTPTKKGAKSSAKVQPTPPASEKRWDLTGNFSYTDDLTSLSWRWITLRTHDKTFYRTGADGLRISPAPVNLSSREPLNALFCRQQHNDFVAETTLADYRPNSPKDLAGLVLLQNEQNNFALGKTLRDGRPVVVLSRAESSPGGGPRPASKRIVIASATLSSADMPLRLRVEGHGRWYTFSYAEGYNDAWHTLATGVDAVNLSTHASGGFIGTVIGLYNTSNNE